MRARSHVRTHAHTHIGAKREARRTPLANTVGGDGSGGVKGGRVCDGEGLRIFAWRVASSGTGAPVACTHTR